MKKVIAMPILLLTSIVILAHAVIPHHHHDGFTVSICNILSGDEVLGNSCNSCHDHHHNNACKHKGHELDEGCRLNELYIRTSSEKDLSSSDSDDLDFLHFPLDFPIICYGIIPTIDLSDYGELPFRQKPYIYSCYNHCVACSLGLRAPPVC